MAALDFARLRANGFRGQALRLDDADLNQSGALVGVTARELRAIIEVESSGSGFYADGRPKMLFEPHRFYALLRGAERDKAVAAGLAYPKWGTKPYPKDSYPRLVQALLINEAAALKACSWGLTQILGENHLACGFPTVQAMVAAFCDDEAAHMAATVLLMKSMGLAAALKARDWARVAKGWNGPMYAKNKYDLKLAAAYARHAKAAKVAARVAAAPSPAPAVKAAQRPAVAKKAPAPLPAVAPLSLGQLVAAWFARLTSPAPRAAAA